MGTVIEEQKKVVTRAQQLILGAEGMAALHFIKVFINRQREKIAAIDSNWQTKSLEKMVEIAAEKRARLSVIEDYEQAARDQAREQIKSESKE